MLVSWYFPLLYSVGARQVRLHCFFNQETDEYLSAGSCLTLLYSVGVRQVRLHCIYSQEAGECWFAGTYLCVRNHSPQDGPPHSK